MAESKSIAEYSSHGARLVVTILVEQLRDVSVVKKLKEGVISQIKSTAAQNVILDCRELRFIASIAFVAFLGIHRQEEVKRIILCNLDENIREVFAICKLIPTRNHATAPFEYAPTLQQAIDMCQDSQQ